MPEVKTIVVPRNIDKLKAALANAKLGEKPQEKPSVNRGAGADAAEARKKAREMAKTVEEKDALVNELNAKLEAAEREALEAKAKVEELTPHADAYKKSEDTERAKLLADMPAELKKEYKDLPIGTLRSVHKLAKTTVTPTGKEGAGSSGKDWNSILAGDPDAANKAIADDTKGFNEHMATLGK